MKPQHITNPGILLFHIPLRKCSQQVLLSWLLEKPTGMACFLVMSTAKQEHRILTALVHDHFDTHTHYLQRSAAVLSMQAGQPSDSETHGFIKLLDRVLSCGHLHALMKTVFRPRPACCRLQLTVKSKVNCSPAHFIFTAVTLHASIHLKKY